VSGDGPSKTILLCEKIALAYNCTDFDEVRVINYEETKDKRNSSGI
jgi:hypothetical protein